MKQTVKAVTEEQKKAIFSVLSGRDTFVCLQTTVLKYLNYQVAPAKTGLENSLGTRLHFDWGAESEGQRPEGIFKFRVFEMPFPGLWGRFDRILIV